MIPLHKIAKERHSIEKIDITCIRYLYYLGYNKFKKSLRRPGTWDLRLAYGNHWVRDVSIRNFITNSTERLSSLPPFSNTWIIE